MIPFIGRVQNRELYRDQSRLVAATGSGCRGGTAKGYRLLLEVNVLKWTVGMGAQLCEDTKNHRITHFTRVK